MSEPVKCPRCKEGEVYERSFVAAYSAVVRLPDGTIDCGDAYVEGDYETDCYTCLDCGAVLVDNEIMEMYGEGGD
jgi:hypothetical protein